MAAYPSHLVEQAVLKDGTAVTIRPIRPEDAELSRDFVRELSDESRYFRFMDTLRELTPSMLAHLTRVDHDLHLALIALNADGAAEVEVGVARYVATPERQSCEFSVVVADAWQDRGLGRHLMRSLIAAARAAGMREMYGDVLAGNGRMLRFAAGLGFKARSSDTDPRVIRVELAL